MKIILEGSKFKDGTIKLSLDGGATYTDYEITDVKENGITVDNIQDYDKIKVKGSANILQNADVVSKVQIYNGFVLDTENYGNTFPNNVVEIIIPDGVKSLYKIDISDYRQLKRIVIPNTVTSIVNAPFEDCYLTSVDLPNSIVNIGTSAFAKWYKLEYINIPNSVTNINSCAFYCCSSLTSIDIPNSVTYLGDRAFDNCSNLTSVNILGKIPYISESTFYRCRKLTSINIPDSVTYIGKQAFYQCTSLISINIPDSVASIKDEAFMTCSGLTNINIPSSVTSIAYNAFRYCSNLTSIKVDENNQNYSTSEDGRCLLSKDKTTIICCPSANGDYTISDGIINIDRDAFYYCTNLTSIALPDSVTAIGFNAFYGCSNLTSITIPEGLTYIGGNAFYNCKSLKTINYKGTQEQWEAIEKDGSYWAYNVPSDMQIIYEYQD